MVDAMRRIVSAGLLWAGVVVLAGAAASYAASLRATEGLADLGFVVLAVLALVLAGGLHGGFLLAAPAGTPRWKLAIAIATAGLGLVAVALMLTQGVDAGTLRVGLFVLAAGIPAAAGLLRSPKLWRA